MMIDLFRYHKSKHGRSFRPNCFILTTNIGISSGLKYKLIKLGVKFIKTTEISILASDLDLVCQLSVLCFTCNCSFSVFVVLKVN